MNAKTAKLLRRATRLNGENYHNTKKLWLRIPKSERYALRELMRAEVQRKAVT